MTWEAYMSTISHNIHHIINPYENWDMFLILNWFAWVLIALIECDHLVCCSNGQMCHRIEKGQQNFGLGML